MGIGYNLNIPAASHTPASDQPNMLSNNNAIATYVAVDHVDFNASGSEVSGQHKQVTFNSNNPPASPTAPPVLFTNTVGSLPQLFFYSGTSTNQYVNLSSGSTYLLGGMILKWGSSGTIGSATSFAIPFPNACYSVVVNGSSSLYSGNFAVTAITTTGFTVVRTDGHSGSTGFYYIAMGY